MNPSCFPMNRTADIPVGGSKTTHLAECRNKPVRHLPHALRIVAVLLATPVGLAAEPTPDDAAAAAEMMKKVEAAGAPGAAHALLEPLVGDWNVEVKMWMTPGEPPMASKGTAKNTWALKKRFLHQDFHGDFMGEAFQGLSLLGFDNVRGKYNSVWVDDMSTTMATSEGEADSQGRTITLTGTYACAMTGEKYKASRQVYRILSRDRHVFEMHDPALGEHSKTLELTYTRK